MAGEWRNLTLRQDLTSEHAFLLRAVRHYHSQQDCKETSKKAVELTVSRLSLSVRIAMAGQ